MSSMLTFKPDYAISPWLTVIAVLHHYGLSPKDIGTKYGDTITEEIAIRIASKTDTRAEFWLSLENNYREYNETKKKSHNDIGA